MANDSLQASNGFQCTAKRYPTSIDNVNLITRDESKIAPHIRARTRNGGVKLWRVVVRRSPADLDLNGLDCSGCRSALKAALALIMHRLDAWAYRKSVIKSRTLLAIFNTRRRRWARASPTEPI